MRRLSMAALMPAVLGAVLSTTACGAGPWSDDGDLPDGFEPAGSAAVSAAARSGARPPSRSGATRPTPGRPSPGRTGPGASGVPARSSSGFADAVAVPCNGRPAAAEVVAVLQRSSVLPAGARPATLTGPLCAGTWQYTILQVADLDPLRVVTRGLPGALVVETAGTDPCTAQVRAAAPPGIRTAARC